VLLDYRGLETLAQREDVMWYPGVYRV